MKKIKQIKPLIAAALLALGGSAMAQTAIDHSKALAGNALPGDAPGYPITLSQSGHYVLKSNLLVPLGVNGIEITGHNVTLDLNGYSVIGAGTCTRNDSTRAVSCTGMVGGGVTGIKSSGNSASIRRGTVMGFQLGIDITDLNTSNSGGVVVEDVLVTRNMTGLNSSNGRGPHVRLSAVSATLNANNGLVVENGLLERCQSNDNGGSGYYLSQYVMLIDSQAFGNYGYGVSQGTLRGVSLQANGNARIGVYSMGGNIEAGSPF